MENVCTQVPIIMTCRKKIAMNYLKQVPGGKMCTGKHKSN